MLPILMLWVSHKRFLPLEENSQCRLFPEKRLAAAEEDVRRANLSDRLANLVERKNLQNQWIKNYQNEIVQLDLEVNNIKLIAEALPEGCFKRQRLEPWFRMF